MFSVLFGIMLAIQVAPVASDVPSHEPQLAFHGSTVALTFGAGKSIYFSASSDSGKTFSAPVKVAEAELVPLSRHRGPRIAFTKHAIVITAVVGKTLAQGPHAHGLPSDGDLLAWHSQDGGKSWSKGRVVNDVPGASTEGLHALVADAQGNLFAAWLDKRGGHGTRLFGARSTDEGQSWSKNVMIYESPEGTICECCHPSLATDSSGQITVMWRNWLAGARDMYLTRSRDGRTFSAPEKLGTGTWQLNACPMDGGGIVMTQGKIVTAWRRGHEIFLAVPGEKEVAIAEGADVAVAAASEGVYAIWSTGGGIKALLPAKSGKREPISIAEKGAFPSIIAFSDGRALAAWEQDGKIQVQPVH